MLITGEELSSDLISEFLDKMRSHGYEPKGGRIVADNRRYAAFIGGEKGEPHGQYSMKIVNADFAIGYFFDFRDKEGTKISWHSKSRKKLTPEERKEVNRRLHQEQKAAEDKARKQYNKAALRYAKVFERLPPATTEHPYLKKKGAKIYDDARHRRKGNELILAARDNAGRIRTLQRITPTGRKYLVSGAEKKGAAFCLCSAEESHAVVCVAEGYATAGSVREAVGFPTYAAIDAGNILPVISALRAKYVDAQFIICHDNDEYTTKAGGNKWNVGREKAEQAAAKIGGAFVIGPEIINEKNTDFDDLRQAKGTDEVKRVIMQVVSSIRTENGGKDRGDNAPNQHLPAVPDNAEMMERDYEGETAAQSYLQGDFGMQFKILGYNNGLYYYFPFRKRQIVALTPSQHTLPNLLQLDRLDNWFKKFGADQEKVSEKKIVMYATNALMDKAISCGVFKIEDRVRGCGAWIDEGRKVLHCGDLLYVDGVSTKFDQLRSDYTYIAAAKLMRPADEPLSTKEAYALRQICERITWENKLSGPLLAGWLVVAPICGALNFRPHIYINGESESGKSTVVNKIIKPVLGKMALCKDGGSTEPSIRQAMDYDARPLIYDEAEKGASMTAVIELARKASTGAMVSKFGQKSFQARFCACFSAINPPVNKTADENRIAFMTIRKNFKSTAIEEYNDLLFMIQKHITPDYSSRLLARTLENLDTLFANIRTFEIAARKVIKGARASEVIGAMLGGLYLLHSTERISDEAAEKWITAHDWTSHTMIDEDSDPTRLLQYLSASLLRYEQPGVTPRYMSIGDLIILAKDHDKYADKILRYNGIAVKDNKIWIAGRSQGLERILKETDWSMKWTRMLLNIQGAEQFRIFYFGVANKTSGVSLPLSLFTEKEPKGAAEISHDDQREINF